MSTFMKSRNFVLLPFILMLVISCSESEQVTGPKVQSIDYIAKAQLGSNLTEFAYKVAKMTQTYKIIQSEVGDSKANKMLENELNKLIAKYQPQWNLNLANAHSEFLSVEEINSLYYNGENSPYFGKWLKLQGEIGTSMQSKSKDLLTKIVSEAMQSAFKNLPVE